MSTRVINSNEIKDEDVTKLFFNIDPSCVSTAKTILGFKDRAYLTLASTEEQLFIDKHSIDNLIFALQEAKRLWSEDDE